MLCGRQGPVDDLLVVGEPHHLGDLPQQVEPGLRRQPLPALGQVVVEPDRLGVVLEDHRRPQFVLREAVRPQDARVLEVLQQLELPQGRPLDGLASSAVPRARTR